MADYYTLFSEVITQLTEEEEAWLKSVLVERDNYEEPDPDDEPVADMPENADQCRDWLEHSGYDSWPAFQYELSEDKSDPAWGRHLWVNSWEGWGSCDAFAALIQDFITVWRPNAVMYIHFAESCSKPRVGAFGGGACRIDQYEQFWVSDSLIDELYESSRDA